MNFYFMELIGFTYECLLCQKVFHSYFLKIRNTQKTGRAKSGLYGRRLRNFLFEAPMTQIFEQSHRANRLRAILM